MIEAGLFVGTLRHRRFTPVAHAFIYPLFICTRPEVLVTGKAGASGG